MPLSTAAAHRKDLTAKPATMSHAHFRTIAAVIRGMPTHAATLRAQQASCAAAFADALARTNPRFDRARFIAACITSTTEA